MNYSIDLSSFSLSNNLFGDFISKYGITRSNLAFQQCINLQRMHGNDNTLPVLIWGTCGAGLIDIYTVKKYTGLKSISCKFILLYNYKSRLIQLVKQS